MTPTVADAGMVTVTLLMPAANTTGADTVAAGTPLTETVNVPVVVAAPAPAPAAGNVCSTTLVRISKPECVLSARIDVGCGPA